MSNTLEDIKKLGLNLKEKYTAKQLEEIIYQLQKNFMSLSSKAPKLINETSESCIGGIFAQDSLSDLVKKLLETAFPQV